MGSASYGDSNGDAQQMDGNGSGIVFVLAAGIVILSASFLYLYAESAIGRWRKTRRQRANSKTPLLGDLGNAHEDDEVKQSVLGRIVDSWRATPKEIEEKKGLAAMLYLESLRNLLVLSFVIALLCCCTTLPVNLSGSRRMPGLAGTTLSNLYHNSTLWVHACVVILTGVLAFWGAFNWRRRTAIAAAQSSIRDAERTCCVWLREIPAMVRVDQVTQCLKEQGVPALLIRRLYDHSSLHEAWLDYLEACEWTDYYKSSDIKSGTAHPRPQAKLRRPSSISRADKVDGGSTTSDGNEWLGKLKKAVQMGDDYWQHEKSEREISCKKELEALGTHEVSSQTWSAIAVFETSDMARQLRQNTQACLKSVTANTPTASLAPNRTDWVWPYVHMPKAVVRTRMLLFNLPLLLLLFTVTSPTMLLSAIDLENPNHSWLRPAIETISGLSPFLQDLITAWLPSMLIVAANSIILIAIEWVSMREGHATLGETLLSVLRKSFAYLFFNTILVPGLLLTSVQGAVGHFSSFKSAYSFLAQIFFLHTGSFFINVLLQSTFVTSAWQILHVPERLSFVVSAAASTMIDVKESNQERVTAFPFYYGYYIALNAVMLNILMIFCAASPVLPVFGCLYFTVRYVVDRYDILQTCPRDPNFNDALASRIPVYILIAAFCQAMFNGAAFALRGATGPATAVFVWGFLILPIGSNWYWKHQVLPDADSVVQFMKLPSISVQELQAMHEHPAIKHFRQESQDQAV